MSIKLKELHGYSNKILGSADYFKAINNATILQYFISSSNSVDYHFELKKSAANCKNILDIIYYELLNHKDLMWLVDVKTKKELITFITSLDDFIQYVKTTSTNAGNALKILKINRSTSGESLSKIVNAAKDMAKGKTIKNYNNKKFVYDVVTASYFEGSDSLKGSCGKGVFTFAYIEYAERQIFGKALSFKNSIFNFRKKVIDGLQFIVDQILKDLELKGKDYYISPKNKKSLLIVADNISKFRIDVKFLKSVVNEYKSEPLELGTAEYFKDLEERAKKSITPNITIGLDPITLSKIHYEKIIYLMMEDFEKYELSKRYWNDFCDSYNKYVKTLGYVKRDMHYFRNKLNNAPPTLDDLYKQHENWVLIGLDDSIFHMYGEDGEYNLKFVSIDGKHEAVYNKDGVLLTAENDPVNMATYNFNNQSNFSEKIVHGIYDVIPYWAWSNTDNSSNIEEDNLKKYYENPDAIENRKEVESKLKKLKGKSHE